MQLVAAGHVLEISNDTNAGSRQKWNATLFDGEISRSYVLQLSVFVSVVLTLE